MNFTNPISEEIWRDRYQHTSEETLDDNIKRVAKFCANNEQEEQEFYNIMDKGLFFPAGRPMANAYEDSKMGLNNCFVNPSVEDDLMEIFEAVKISAKVQQFSGGIGNDFSLLRPKGTTTSRGAIASGVVSFMNVFNVATDTVKSHNRRGANMGCLSIRHPDIYDFITAKANDTEALKYFNISVMVDDDFLHAVENDEEAWLHWPVYDEKFNIITDENKWQIKKKIRAKELWDEIMLQAYNTGEPGVLFYNSMNRDNNTSYIETITATNPCGEYLAGTVFGHPEDGKLGGACNLGSLFLHNYVLNPFTENAILDKNLLKKTIYTAIRFLDNIIDKNNYPLDMYKNYQKNFRTVGLGITGLGDMLIMLGMRYGSKKSLEYVDNLMDFISYWAYKASIALAKEKNPFPYFEADKFCEAGYLAKKAIKDNKWHTLKEEVRQYGIRNARMVVIAPTGTISMTFGNNCSSGIEPVFSLEYDRRVHVGGQEEENIKIIKFKDYAYDLAEQKGITIDKNTLVTALELPVEDHVNMLKTVAYHSDSSISKTINIPEDYPFEETKKVYIDCWKNGVKGCTIFRPNPIRYGILIDPNKKEENKQSKEIEDNITNIVKYNTISPIEKEEIGTTYGANVKKITSCGKLHINVARDREGNLVELYVSGSKGGICMANINAISRLVSLALRSGIKVDEIVDQLKGIDCRACMASKAKGFNLDGISCPDIIGKVLQQEYKEGGSWLNTSEKSKTLEEISNELRNRPSRISYIKKDKKCPECGEPITNNGGCVICLSCGWTKCE